MRWAIGVVGLCALACGSAVDVSAFGDVQGQVDAADSAPPPPSSGGAPGSGGAPAAGGTGGELVAPSGGAQAASGGARAAGGAASTGGTSAGSGGATASAGGWTASAGGTPPATGGAASDAGPPSPPEPMCQPSGDRQQTAVFNVCSCRVQASRWNVPNIGACWTWQLLPLSDGSAPGPETSQLCAAASSATCAGDDQAISAWCCR